MKPRNGLLTIRYLGTCLSANVMKLVSVLNRGTIDISAYIHKVVFKDFSNMNTEKPGSPDLEATLPTGQVAPDRSSQSTPPAGHAAYRVQTSGRTDVGLRR